MNKKAKWTKKRHNVVKNIVYPFLYLYSKKKYGISIRKFKEQNRRAYLILYNHQTPFDQFFVGMSIPGAIYYLATEDIFSNGFVSALIRWLVAPIPINKQTADILAIKNCIKVAKEGGSIAIAPEGNRTYSGKTEYMSPSIAPLAKKIGLPILLYKIEGGYGVQPRWSDVARKGKMRAYVSKVIEPEEYAGLSNDEFFEMIQNGLYVNEAASNDTFEHKKRAEYLERLLYVCPFCGLSEFESHNEHVICKKCGRKIVYEPNTELKGADFDLPFKYVNDWYEYQKEFICKLDLSSFSDVIYTDTVRLSEVVIGKRKNTLHRTSSLRLYADRVTATENENATLEFLFDDIQAMAVMGRNKLNIYHKAKIYQIKGGKRFNAVKYVNIFYHYKNTKEDGKNGKFLGL